MRHAVPRPTRLAPAGGLAASGSDTLPLPMSAMRPSCRHRLPWGVPWRGNSSSRTSRFEMPALSVQAMSGYGDFIVL
ncbi:MAG TPA: hypothetical protein VE029_11490 [Rhizobacter sp.]|nr:hypothetical protein [Rhizobacter sp.]